MAEEPEQMLEQHRITTTGRSKEIRCQDCDL